MKQFYNLKARLAIIAACCLSAAGAVAQTVASYSFSQSTGTYTTLTGGTVLGTTTNDDNNFNAQNIGFTFIYNGNPYTTVGVNANGFISMGGTVLSSYTAISTGTSNNVISAFNRDIQAQAGAELSIQTIGLAPNRTCVIQWVNYRKYLATGDNYNFQIRLNETTNIIDVMYGTMINNATGTTTQVGLRGASSADFNNRTTTTNWASTTAGVVNSASCTVSTAVVPVSGQTFSWSPPAGCSGMPVGGTTVSSANPVCSGVSFTLSVTGATVASGLTYQWQSSPDGITYTNIAGATAATLSTTQSAATYYQLVITCTSAAMSAPSAAVQVTMNTFSNCYCSSGATNTADEEIFGVTVNGSTNAYGCTTVAPGPGSVLNRYSNFTTLPALTTLTQGSTFPFSIQEDECDGATYYAFGTAIWIDFNQNGSFTDPGEQVFVEGTTSTGPRNVTGTFNVPVGATLGNTRMRITCAEGYAGAALTPCLSYGYGETEDYIVTISAASSCSGTPNGGNTLSTASTVCPGTNFTLSMSTPPSGLTGITYQWQSSTDGGVTYTSIGGATNNSYTTNQSVDTYYQCIINCTLSGMADTTTALGVTMNSFLNCYCTSNATSTADEEILNVTLVSLNNTSTCATTGGPGSIMSQYSDYTTIAAAPTLAQSAVYPFSVQVGTCGGSFTNSTRIFIDYNHNGLFTDAGETVYTSAAGTVGPHFETGNITIPLSALTGNTRMRVITVETGTPTSITPCGTYTWGETEDYLVNIVPLPPNPPAPVQSATAPTCSAGTDLTVPGSPAAGDAWYWQTATAGTSTSNPVSGPYTVFLNGTYYVRTYNATYNIWSAGSDSVVVSNMPLAPTPPAPTAGANPACLSTSLTMSAPATGTGYFWQGTNSSGASNAQDAATPYPVNTSGTYYVAAYDSLTSCWSQTSNISVAIDTYVPSAPVASADSIMICQGSPSAIIGATATAASGSIIASFGSALISTGTGATTYSTTAGSIPAGATITSTQLQIFGATAQGGSYRSEIRVALSGATTLAATQISTLSSGGLITPDPVIAIPALPAAGGAVTLSLTETFDDGGTDATFDSIRIVINYTLPASVINWWDAPAAGVTQGTGVSLETVGTLHLPDSNTPGTVTFYAAASSGSCASSRVPVNVIINPLPSMVLSDTAICSGNPYVLDAQNSGAGYLWNTADTTQTVTTSTAGLYYVDITTSFGCAARDSMNLIINNPPIVNLGADVAFCAGDSILLDAANTGFNFLWNDSTTNQTITTSMGGSFSVMVTNPMTTCAASDTIMVTVNALPVINLGIDTAFCAGDSVILNAGNPGASYSWNDASTNQTLAVNTPSTYFVFVTDPVTTCYSSDTITIAQNSLPVIAIGADTSICNGNTLLLDAGHPGSAFTWSDASTAQTLAVTMAGTYSVMVVDSNGCKGMDSVTVGINPLPVVNLGPDTTQCAGTVMLDAANAGSMFMWNDMSTAQTLTTASTGTYAVAVTDVNGCTSVDSVDVTINSLPVVDLGNDTVQCGGSLVLDAGNPGFTHLWYDSSTGQTLTVYATNTVSVTVINPATGCLSMDTVTVTFNQYPVVNLGSDTAQCAGSITLNAGNAGSTFSWNTSATTQTINVSATGSYIVGVTNSGCTTYDTVAVTINPLPSVGFPAVATLCEQGGILNMTATPSGGTFTGSAAISGTGFDPMIAGPGAHPVLYTYTDANACSNSVSQTINVNDCTGIEELDALNSINVYPNPTDGMFNIAVMNANFNELNIRITDIQGKEVFNFIDKNIAGDYNRQIDLEGLAKGIYYIRLTTGEKARMQKLVIQ